jgi:hypothetical protein
MENHTVRAERLCGEISQGVASFKETLVYFKTHHGSSENMAYLDNMSIILFTVVLVVYWLV